MTDYIQIGQIINTHGHKGGLKIYPLTDDAERFYELARVYVKLNDNYTAYTVSKVQLHKNLVLLTLVEIPDMNAAERLKGLYLEIPKEEARPLAADSYYIFQLMGLDVFAGEHYLGKLCEVLKPGSNDVFVVKTPEDKEIYLPALKSVVTGIDLEHGRMEVKIPPGLLD
jgi:16S rRNA processing protein RimM